MSGSFPNKSSFVRVSEVKSTLNYLDSNGRVRVGAASASLPAAVSGTFANGSDGNVIHPISFFETISDTNTQGFNLANGNEGLTSYIDAIRLLKNQDEYDINLLVLPGIVDNLQNHAAVISEAISMVEDRGDCFLVYDPVEY